MPRNGDGSSDNAIENTHDIIHGAGAAKTSHIDRADKTAELPEHEKGAGLKGMNASGGQSAGLTHGPLAGQGGRSTKN
ncbi:hypothetical protein B0T18DRAFT_323903 [Schizothecium vesticola]|uniref:Uncharacterized protein n=1 Tax=Schizothecium vesticola TaxID=314040 RepID=A0AA40F194_9PEZI|nr:hypothetical protein B0T18DRAFT_323903 [Schizothecium vesticola]